MINRRERHAHRVKHHRSSILHSSLGEEPSHAASSREFIHDCHSRLRAVTQFSRATPSLRTSQLPTGEPPTQIRMERDTIQLSSRLFRKLCSSQNPRGRSPSSCQAPATVGFRVFEARQRTPLDPLRARATFRGWRRVLNDQRNMRSRGAACSRAREPAFVCVPVGTHA